MKRVMHYLAGDIMVVMLLLGCEVQAHAANSYNILDLQVGDTVSAGDIIYNRGNEMLADYYSVGIYYTSEVYDDYSYIPHPAGTSYILGKNQNPDTEAQVNSLSGKWQVGKLYDSDGFRYTVFLRPLNEEPQDKTEEQGSIAQDGHDHDYQWETETEATETTDGYMVYKCSCGDIAARVLGGSGDTSAYAVFNKNVIDKINKTLAGETVAIDTKLWTSFSKSVMVTMAARRDVNVDITYKLQGNTYKIDIAAGAEVPTDVDFAGFDGYLAGLYGKVEMSK